MVDQVTVLAYFFCTQDQAASSFPALEHAVRETWRHCGLLKTVFVANEAHACLRVFAAHNPNVEIQVEPLLVPGDIHSMSVDCNARLYRRFATPYVLIVQNDGYPLRSGLEEFVGKYDFIGAPYVRDVWWKNMICRLLNCWVQNGGFSLRSKRICEAASRYWEKYCETISKAQAAEDLFYTQYLPLHERKYRRSFRLATNRESLLFSWDALVPIPPPSALPFGFHRTGSLRMLGIEGGAK